MRTNSQYSNSSNMEVRRKVKLTRLTTMGGGGAEALGPFVGHKPNWNFGNWLIIAALHVRGFNFDISPSSGSSFFYFFWLFGENWRIGNRRTLNKDSLIYLDWMYAKWGNKEIASKAIRLWHITLCFSSVHHPQCTFRIER